MHTRLYYILLSMRPRQWTKNVLVFAPLLFSRNLQNLDMLATSIIACVVFCMLSGCVYLLNDLLDLEQDKQHPIKCQRPIASGKLSPTSARIALALLLCGTTLPSLMVLNTAFLVIAAAYLVLQIAYSVSLKHIVIIDVFCIATGFVLRVAAGAEAIDVIFSNWLLFCTMLLSLFLALSKRRHELVLLEDKAGEHRRILFEYSPTLLDQMIAIVTPTTLIAYILYTISEDTIAKFGTDKLKFTVPFVMYGIFRYLYLIHHRNEGGAPEQVLLSDKPILICVLLYALASFLILYLCCPT